MDVPSLPSSPAPSSRAIPPGRRLDLIATQAGMAIGCVTFAIAWVFSHAPAPEGHVNRLLLPLNTFIYGTLCLLLMWRPRWLDVLRSLALYALGMHIAARLGLTLFLYAGQGDPRLLLGLVTPWTPVFLFGLFTVVERRRAIQLGLGYWAVTLGICIAYVLWGPRMSKVPQIRYLLFHTYFTANGLYLAMATLMLRVRRSQITAEEQAERYNLLALTDLLTGLPNRRYGEQTLSAKVNGKQLYSVLLCDVDHFKQVNDRFGHPAGDAVLRQVGTALRDSLRVGDVVCRWGGEEFIVIIDGGAPEAEALGQRLLGAMRSQIFPEVGRVTISIGVALGRSGDSLTSVLQRVDGALYAAKQQGRDRLVSNASER